jgi:hypothetical protein
LENRWRVIAGMNGERLQGLDMAQAESVLRLMGMRRKERQRVFKGLRIMEAAALMQIYGTADQAAK